MLRALGEYEIEPLTTLIPFHKAILATEQWAKGETCRDLTEDKKWLKSLAPEAPARARRGARTDEERAVERDYTVEVDGRLHAVKVIGAAAPAGGGRRGGRGRRPPKRERSGGRRRRRRRPGAALAAAGHGAQGRGRRRAPRSRRGR